MDTKNTEEVILRAAEKLFIKQGFAATTMAQIAKEAKCNSALVHYYFRSKKNLFEQVFEAKANEYCQQFFSTLGKPKDLDQFMQAASKSHWDFMLKHHEVGLFMIREVLDSDERLRLVYDRAKAALAQLAEQMQPFLEAEQARGIGIGVTAQSLINLGFRLDATAFHGLLIESRLAGKRLKKADTLEAREEVLTLLKARLHYQA